MRYLVSLVAVFYVSPALGEGFEKEQTAIYEGGVLHARADDLDADGDNDVAALLESGALLLGAQ